MADYVMLRKGRNALSSLVHVSLNIGLALASTALTVISGNWVFGILLVLLSKWRVIAVRPRYWWVNIKANLVDFIVGVSLVFLVYLAGTDNINAWHYILTIIYALWLVFIKPQTSAFFTRVQAACAIFFGSFVVAIGLAHFNPIFCGLASFIIGYGSSRHVLMQGDDRDFTLSTFISGMLLTELSWIFYHWSIVYRVNLFDTSIAIPQLPIAAFLVFFVASKGYLSALKHDGKIRAEDIVLPVVFSVSLILVMVFLFSKANFDV